MRILFVAGWRTNLALFRWLTPAALLTTVVGVPACQLLWFVHLGRYVGTLPVEYYAVGNAMHACAMACLFAPAMSIAGERMAGTLTAILATPANRTLMFAGRVIPAIGLGTATSIAMFAFGSVLADFDVPADRIVPLLVAVVVTSTSCAAFGLVIGAVGLRTRETLLLANLVLYLMLLVCGVNVPLSDLPEWLQAIGRALPLTQGIEAARRTITSDDGAWLLMAVELAKTVVYLAITVAALHVLELGSRRNASLDER